MKALPNPLNIDLLFQIFSTINLMSDSWRMKAGEARFCLASSSALMLSRSDL